MDRIFINYRRSDALPYADRLHEVLAERYGDTDVFRDVDTIEPGLDFVIAIEQALNKTKVMLVLIGKGWLVERDGRRRLDDPDDYVRNEVAAALRRQEVRVIPVLVGGGVMPSSEDLPPDLKPLVRRNAFEMTDERWRFDRQQLELRLDTVLGRPASTAGPGPGPSTTDAPPPVTPTPTVKPKIEDPVSSYVKRGWILTGTSLILPVLAFGAIWCGILVIVRSGGRRAPVGAVIILVAVIVAVFSTAFWVGVVNGASMGSSS